MNIRTNNDSLLLFLGVLFISATILNWPWEMLQMPFYEELAESSWSETAMRCTIASLGDGVIALGIYGVGALVTRRAKWGMHRRTAVYFSTAMMGIAVALLVEWWAVSVGRWSYSDRMPVVPLLNVGLSPLLQLAILMPLTFLVTNLLNEKINKMRGFS